MAVFLNLQNTFPIIFPTYFILVDLYYVGADTTATESTIGKEEFGNESLEFIDNLENNYQTGFSQIMEFFSTMSTSLEKINRKINELETVGEERHNHVTKKFSLIEAKEKLLEMKLLTHTLPPIGFVYIQYSNQSAPSTLWPTATWTAITHNFGGAFFRAEGGKSSSFGQSQAESFRTLVFEFLDDYHEKRSDSMPFNSWAKVSTGGWSGSWTGLHVRYSHDGNEVRPCNQAVRIWKRTN